MRNPTPATLRVLEATGLQDLLLEGSEERAEDGA
jgi:hypothetical protein